jgi:hypothetical protein
MKRTSFFCVGALLLLAANGVAGIGGRRSPLELAQSADLVIAGSASNGAQAGGVINFTIQVVRVVKGDASLAGGSITVAWALSGGPARTPSATVLGSGLWFLQRSGGGWTLEPAMDGDVPFEDLFLAAPVAPLPSAYVYSASAPLSDAIASEVAAAIESAPPDSFRLQYLHQGPLDRLNSPVVQLLYQRLAGSSATDKQILGLAGQIRWGKANALSAAAQSASSFAAFALEDGVLLQSVQYEFRASDPASVAILGQVVDDTNGNLPFRRAAAFALAAIHTQQALPYLAALMTDADPEMRAESVRGLGSFANGLPVQTTAGTPSLSYLQPQPNSAYRTDDTITHHPLNIQYIEENESQYLPFWQAWWQTNHAALGY